MRTCEYKNKEEKRIRFVLIIQQKHIHIGKLNFLQELFNLFKKKNPLTLLILNYRMFEQRIIKNVMKLIIISSILNYCSCDFKNNEE